MTTDNFYFYLQNRLIQTSQSGGQWYSDTSPFSIPWLCCSAIGPFSVYPWEHQNSDRLGIQVIKIIAALSMEAVLDEWSFLAGILVLVAGHPLLIWFWREGRDVSALPRAASLGRFAAAAAAAFVFNCDRRQPNVTHALVGMWDWRDGTRKKIITFLTLCDWRSSLIS